MDDGNQSHADGVGTRHGDWRESTGVSDADAGEAGEQEPEADEEHGARQAAAGGKDTEAEDDLPKARQHPEDGGWSRKQEEGENGSGDARWEELRDGHADHLIGQAGVEAIRTPEHLRGDERGGDDGSGKPESGVLYGVPGGLWEAEVLDRAREQGEDGRGRERKRAIAAELCGLRDLTADGAYVDECFL